MSFAYRLRVNDVVRSFVYIVRSGDGSNWQFPYPLLGQQAHAEFDVRHHRTVYRYHLFVDFAMRQSKKPMAHILRALTQLEMVTNTWSQVEWDYADYLLNKYYGVEIV